MALSCFDKIRASNTGPSNILFVGVYACTFQPGNFTGWASEGVNVSSRDYVGRLLVTPEGWVVKWTTATGQT